MNFHLSFTFIHLKVVSMDRQADKGRSQAQAHQPAVKSLFKKNATKNVKWAEPC